jgi:hypothetical protein
VTKYKATQQLENNDQFKQLTGVLGNLHIKYIEESKNSTEPVYEKRPYDGQSLFMHNLRYRITLKIYILCT